MTTWSDRINRLTCFVLKRIYCVVNRFVYNLLLMCFVIVPGFLVFFMPLCIFLIFGFAHNTKVTEDNGTRVTYDRVYTFTTIVTDECVSIINETGTFNETCKPQSKHKILWLHFGGYILFVEVIGRDVGFYWNDVYTFVYIVIGLELEYRFVILWYMYRNQLVHWINRRCPVLHRLVGVLSNYRCLDRHHCNIDRSSHFIKLPYNLAEERTDLESVSADKPMTVTVNYKLAVTSLVSQTWRPDVDGTSLGSNARIHVSKVKKLSSEFQYLHYYTRKKRLLKSIWRSGGSVYPPEYYSKDIRSVATSTVDPTLCDLVHNVDTSVNEFYLFSLVDESRVDSEDENNVRLRKEVGPVGEAFYFTDNLAHVCQDKGIHGDCRAVVSRVLLGNTTIQTTLTCNNQLARSAPCRHCYRTKRAGDEMFPPDDVFDSVIYDTGSRRSYVLYHDRAFPEFLVWFNVQQ